MPAATLSTWTDLLIYLKSQCFGRRSRSRTGQVFSPATHRKTTASLRLTKNTGSYSRRDPTCTAPVWGTRGDTVFCDTGCRQIQTRGVILYLTTSLRNSPDSFIKAPGINTD